MDHRIAVTLLLAFTAAACNANSPGGNVEAERGQEAAEASRAQVPHSTPSGEQSSKDGQMDELAPFIKEGEKLLDKVVGDLDADGWPDALLVLDPPTTGEGKSGKSPSRTVLLLVRDASGKLQKAAQNDKIVPCSKCGGILGDPFGYVRIDKGSFTVLIEGGSRQRWHSEYAFQYSSQSNGWHLQKVERGAFDTVSQEKVSKTFTPEDFGQVAFQDFDPSNIPEVVLP